MNWILVQNEIPKLVNEGKVGNYSEPILIVTRDGVVQPYTYRLVYRDYDYTYFWTTVHLLDAKPFEFDEVFAWMPFPSFDAEAYEPCMSCGNNCDGWDAMYCCTLCKKTFDGDTPCDYCDPMDV